MKVLFVTNMYPVDDYIYFGIHVKEQIDSLRECHGVQTDIFFIDGRHDKLNYYRSISGVRNKIRANHYDLIHVHYGISGLFLLFFKPDIPTVVTLHSGELFGKKGFVNSTLQRMITLKVVKRADRIIILNDDTAKVLQTFSEKLVKQPCGTDIAIFKNRPVIDASKKFVIGFPGNKLRKEKNFKLFDSIIRRLQKDLDIEVIEFHNITRDEVLNNLNRIDVLLMTSTKEGSPQIVKEAMACNKAVISTSVGDVNDLLLDVSNCVVVNSFNPEDFIKPIQALSMLPRSQRVSNGRDKIIAMSLDKNAVASRIYDLYTSL